MKLQLLIPAIALVLTSPIVSAQGTLTFVYDQQSSTNESPLSFGSGTLFQQLAPYGQSFTPSLSAIGFIRLNLADGNLNDALGATLSVNLRSDSITGSILASAGPVTLSNLSQGTVDFYFASEVQVNTGTTYNFEPIVQPGSSPWRLMAGELNYSGGSVFANGGSALNSDVWFREGIVVPEPSAWVLLAGGAYLLAWLRKRVVP